MQDQSENNKDCLQLFGTWRFFRNQAPIFLSLRQQRLVAAIAILGRSNRNYLAGLLWPETTDPRSMSSLRVSVCLISKKIPELLVCDGTSLSLNERVVVDLHQAWERIGLVLQGESDGHDARNISELQRGELLPGWYDDFVLQEQNRLQTKKMQCFKWIARDSLDHGQHDMAVLAARAALELEPYDDDALMSLIRAEQRLGNYSGANRIYHEYARLVRTDLGISPTASMTALAARNPPPYFI